MQRHLLVQEVTNKLLQADMARRDTELTFLRDTKKTHVLKRWKTFSGRDVVIREVGQETVSIRSDRKHYADI
jgi:hypothetical protein